MGTRILMPLTWRTRCIRNAPCRCIAYAVSSFSADSSGQCTFFSCSSILQQVLIQIGSGRNFVDKAHPFNRFSVNSVIFGLFNGKYLSDNQNLVLIHLHSHPLFHMVYHLCIGFDVDAHVFLIHGHHDSVCLGGRIAGCIIKYFVRLI